MGLAKGLVEKPSTPHMKPINYAVSVLLNGSRNRPPVRGPEEENMNTDQKAAAVMVAITATATAFVILTDLSLLMLRITGVWSDPNWLDMPAGLVMYGWSPWWVVVLYPSMMVGFPLFIWLIAICYPVVLRDQKRRTRAHWNEMLKRLSSR